jgi:tRNA-Thr(GGU) m(6)t(6)A37 methyltransferase TsaA
MKTSYEIYPVGCVRRKDDKVYLEIKEKFRPALRELQYFSHIQVLWWCHSFDEKKFREMTQFDPPFEAPRLGIFASRAPMRPNPIAISTVKVKQIDLERGLVEICKIDAYNDTPVIDLKGYMPFYSRVKSPQFPSWTSGWPQWMPDEGIGVDEKPS